MSNKLQIQRLIPPNDPHTRIYFSRVELTKKNATAVRGVRGVRDPVLTAALEIPGVALAHVTPYSLMVSKAPTYEWEEIEGTLLRLLSAFNLDEGELEKLA